MTEKSKETSTKFVVPYFDFVIVSSGNNQGLNKMKVDSADGSIVFFESVNDCSDTIIPTEEGYSSRKGRSERTLYACIYV